MIYCDRYWLLTWTMYGNWLPGDDRGFVSNVREGNGPEVRHNKPGTEYDASLPNLQRAAKIKLVGEPVRIGKDQAEALFAQFQETERARGWRLFAVAIMANHCHLVIGVPGDPDPENLLRDLKSYGSRKFKSRWQRPQSGTWWTESGSKRKLSNNTSVLAAIRYLLEQEFPLLIWVTTVPELNLTEGRVC
jgi:REP element-mobilizing transposase RayT